MLFSIAHPLNRCNEKAKDNFLLQDFLKKDEKAGISKCFRNEKVV
jgi:hypothetical protein